MAATCCFARSTADSHGRLSVLISRSRAIRRGCSPSGGPITHDNTNAETYCTIYAIAEGSRAGSIWAGTDDGHLYRTGNDGASWDDVGKNISGVPAHAIVASIETSKTDAGVAYVTFDAHRLGDTHPYVYMTRDSGASWTRIDHGLPLWAYVVRADPRATSLLFAGTEDGLWMLVRSWRALARFPLRHEPRAGLRSADPTRCKRSYRGHAWPRLCDP